MDELNPTIKERQIYHEMKLSSCDGQVHPYPLRCLPPALR